MIIAEWEKIGYNYQGNCGGVAQRLEQRAHNLLVAGSIPATPTRNYKNTAFDCRIF